MHCETTKSVDKIQVWLQSVKSNR